jgi:hypothetical protein
MQRAVVADRELGMLRIEPDRSYLMAGRCGTYPDYHLGAPDRPQVGERDGSVDASTKRAVPAIGRADPGDNKV